MDSRDLASATESGTPKEPLSAPESQGLDLALSKEVNEAINGVGEIMIALLESQATMASMMAKRLRAAAGKIREGLDTKDTRSTALTRSWPVPGRGVGSAAKSIHRGNARTP